MDGELLEQSERIHELENAEVEARQRVVDAENDARTRGEQVAQKRGLLEGYIAARTQAEREIEQHCGSTDLLKQKLQQIAQQRNQLNQQVVLCENDLETARVAKNDRLIRVNCTHQWIWSIVKRSGVHIRFLEFDSLKGAGRLANFWTTTVIYLQTQYIK